MTTNIENSTVLLIRCGGIVFYTEEKIGRAGIVR